MKAFTLPTIREVGHLTVTLAISAVGATVFVGLDLPLPFLLGALTATLLSSLLGFNPRVPMWLFLTMLGILGVYAGSALDTELLAGLMRWPISLLAMLVLVVATTTLNTAYFERYAGFSRITAMFASVPGAQTLALLMCARYGGDERQVIIPQITRVLTVIYFVPVILIAFGTWAGIDIARVRGAPSEPWVVPDWQSVLLAISVSLTAMGLAFRLRWPQPTMLGPLCGIAILQVAGVTELNVPGQALIPVQFVLGTFLGTRFAKVKWRSALGITGHGLVALAMTFIGVVLMTGLLTLLTDIPPAALLLAFAPGGLPEMVLIAATLNIDPAFVVVHQITRFLVIALVMPWAVDRIARPLQK